MTKRGAEREGSSGAKPAKVSEAEGHVAEKHNRADTAGDSSVLFYSTY